MALETTQRSMSRTKPIFMLVTGVVQYYLFWLLYYYVRLPIIASIIAIVGTILQIVGIAGLIRTAKTAQAQVLMVCLFIGLGLFWGCTLLRYIMLIQENIFIL